MGEAAPGAAPSPEPPPTPPLRGRPGGSILLPTRVFIPRKRNDARKTLVQTFANRWQTKPEAKHFTPVYAHPR